MGSVWSELAGVLIMVALPVAARILWDLLMPGKWADKLERMRRVEDE